MTDIIVAIVAHRLNITTMHVHLSEIDSTYVYLLISTRRKFGNSIFTQDIFTSPTYIFVPLCVVSIYIQSSTECIVCSQ